MVYKLVVPPTADGNLNITVLKWLKKTGDSVVKGEDIVEAKTEKITLYVTAPTNGILVEILIPVGAKAKVNDELGSIEGS
jgi:pyruvate/2-oxoglutarate dehydrogenase complex dihydrolipoamide acyltransferase (E2) component